MPPRPALPDDDLYARLELPSGATPEAIELAWRALLRRHHPDVAGPAGLERAKRINVAHDWLSDPALRARYDRERVDDPADRARRGPPWRDGVGRGRPGPTGVHPRPPRQVDVIELFLARVASLTGDELDRLALADPAPIAFGAAIRRFLPDELRASLRAVEREVDRRLPPAAASSRVIRETVHAHAAELVLGPFLDELLSEPFRSRARERLSRGWDAAVGQPRYGPNGAAVQVLLARLQEIDRAGLASLATSGSRAQLGEEPWPPGTSPEDDEALRVSSALAGRDAVEAVDAAASSNGPGRTPTGLRGPVLARARRAAQRIAHLLVLRHAFPPVAFEALTAPWRPSLLPSEPRVPRVGRPPRA